MTIKTHGRMFTDNTVGITQLDITDGTANQAIVTDGQGVLRFATVGAGGSVGSSVYIEDIRTGDGTTATFTLSAAAPYEESILVFIDGVAQPTSSFTLPTTESITFSPAPGNGAAIRICHLGIASSIADCSVTGAKICMGGDTTGDILFYNGTSYQRLVIGTALQILRTNAAVNAPEWVNATTASLPAVGAYGNVLTSDASNWSSQPPLGGVGGELVSIQTFAGNGSNVIAENTSTWTRPAGVKRIEVHIVGAGGYGQGDPTGGGGGPANVSSGGGAGGYCVGLFDVTNLSTATVIVGASNDAAGVRNSSFSGTGITTLAAGGGGFSASSNSYTSPVAGGTATGGMLNFVGEQGSLSHGAGHARFGGDYGDGVDPVSSSTVTLGKNGYCYIKEYSDASASLVGEKLVSHQVFTASGTWTRPANITKIKVHVIGPGGASGSNASYISQGGGGGGYSQSLLDVTSISTAPVVIGTSIISNPVSSIAQSNSSFNTTIVGGFGDGSLSIGSSDAAGTGGVASGGNVINVTGEPGGVDDNTSAQQVGHGGEGAGPFGGLYGRGAIGTIAASTTPNPGNPGLVVVEEYSDASLVSGGSLVPAGVLNPYAGATAPAGWLLCYGQAISRTVYSTLFTAIGTVYGVGDGSTTFALPDMRGRTVAGQDDMGGTSANRLAGSTLNGDTLGAVGGDEDLISDTTSVTAAAHASPYSGGGTGWRMTNGGNVQPTIILNYIIKT